MRNDRQLRWSTSESSPDSRTVIQNPMLSYICSPNTLIPTNRRRRDALNYPKASWKKMLISQPPITELDWHEKNVTDVGASVCHIYHFDIPEPGLESTETLQKNEGIKMIDLTDLIPKYLFSRDGLSPVVRIDSRESRGGLVDTRHIGLTALDLPRLTEQRKWQSEV